MLGLWALNLSNNFSSGNKREHTVQKATYYIRAQRPWILTFLLKWNKNPNPALRTESIYYFHITIIWSAGEPWGPLRALRVGRHPPSPPRCLWEALDAPGIKGLCVIFLMTTGLASMLLSLLPPLSFLISSSLSNRLRPPNHLPWESRHADVGAGRASFSEPERFSRWHWPASRKSVLFFGGGYRQVPQRTTSPSAQLFQFCWAVWFAIETPVDVEVSLKSRGVRSVALTVTVADPLRAGVRLGCGILPSVIWGCLSSHCPLTWGKIWSWSTMCQRSLYFTY